MNRRQVQLIYHKRCAGTSANEQGVCFLSNSNAKQKSRLCEAHAFTTDRVEVSDVNRLVKEIKGWDAFSLERDLFQSARYLKNLNRARIPRSEK
jgi:tRNA 2-selenouridine synthase SelU